MTKAFTNQKPRKATKKDINAPWNGVKGGKEFRCHLCGYRFLEGDVWRFVLSDRKNIANVLVCYACDGTNKEVLDDMEELFNKFNDPCFWTFRRKERIKGEYNVYNGNHY